MERARVSVEVFGARLASYAMAGSSVVVLWRLFRFVRELVPEGVLGNILACGALLPLLPLVWFIVRAGRATQLGFLYKIVKRVAGQMPASASGSQPVAAPSSWPPDRSAEAGKLIHGGKVEKGLRLLDELPRSPRTLHYRAVALCKLGRIDDAATIARELLAVPNASAASIAAAALVLATAHALRRQSQRRRERWPRARVSAQRTQPAPPQAPSTTTLSGIASSQPSRRQRSENRRRSA